MGQEGMRQACHAREVDLLTHFLSHSVGVFPGPTISANLGDDIAITVVNRLQGVNIAFQWHGIPQTGTNYMDGTPFVTQCPIMSGNTFTYRFKATQPGTYWWQAQAEDYHIDSAVGKDSQQAFNFFFFFSLYHSLHHL
jgi:hypothetical protein